MHVCATAIVHLSARVSSAPACQVPESSLTLLLFLRRSPFIFLSPVSFKETEVKRRTRELENKSRRYLQPRRDPDTFQLCIPPCALFPDPLRAPLQLRKCLRRFIPRHYARRKHGPPSPILRLSALLFYNVSPPSAWTTEASWC